MMRKTIFFVIVLSLLPIYSHAATINAASCSQAHVETAIAAASTGDTVVIPSGTCAWTSQVTVDKAITVQGQTTIFRNETTFVLTPTDSTYIEDYGFNVTPTSGVRITGITFDNNDAMGRFLTLPNGLTSLRVDHCHFQAGQRLWAVKGNPPTGFLFDHNLVVNPTNESWYINGTGDDSWVLGGSAGASNTDEATWIENNEFRWDGGGSGAPVDHGNGARAVWRYNRFTGDGTIVWGADFFEAHGHCYTYRDSDENAGTYSVEVYGNKFYRNTTSTASYTLFKMRGGRTIFYGNEIYSDEAETTAQGWHPSVLVWLFPEEAVINCNNAAAGPCANQTHEDQGWHVVPIADDTSYSGANTMCTSYPCSSMQPMNSYVWNNTRATGTSGVSGLTVLSPPGDGQFIQENRDYWTDSGNDAFTSGAASARPASCADDDVYFATDTEVLSRCDGTDNWTTVYTAYTYPHPLTGESGEPPTISAPSGFRTGGGSTWR